MGFSHSCKVPWVRGCIQQINIWLSEYYMIPSSDSNPIYHMFCDKYHNLYFKIYMFLFIAMMIFKQNAISLLNFFLFLACNHDGSMLDI